MFKIRRLENIQKINSKENPIVFLIVFSLPTYKYLSFYLEKVIYFSTSLSTSFNIRDLSYT